MKLDPKVYELAAEMVDSGESNGHRGWLKNWNHLPSCFAIEQALKQLNIPRNYKYHHYFHSLYFDSDNCYSNLTTGAYFGYDYSGTVTETSKEQKNHRVFALLMAAHLVRESNQRRAIEGSEYKWTRNPKNMKGGIPRNLRPESVVTYKMNEANDDFTDEQRANNLVWNNSISESARITAYKVITY